MTAKIFHPSKRQDLPIHLLEAEMGTGDLKQEVLHHSSQASLRSLRFCNHE